MLICAFGEIIVLLIFLSAYFYFLLRKGIRTTALIERLLAGSLKRKRTTISSVLLALFRISHGKNGDYYIFAGDLEFLNGNPKKAIGNYAKGRNERNLYGITYKIGNCHYSISDYEESLRCYSVCRHSAEWKDASELNIIAIYFIIDEIGKCLECLEMRKKHRASGDFIKFVEGLIDELHEKEHDARLKYESLRGETVFSERAKIRIAVIDFNADKTKLCELEKLYRDISPDFRELGAYLAEKNHDIPWLLKKPKAWTMADRSKWVSIDDR
jgi:tetratricopeptide (TPR) repeat protein